MNFSEGVKAELIKIEYDSACCERAALSAFIRSAGTVSVRGGRVGFEVTTDGDYAEYFSAFLKKLYGAVPEIISGEDKPSKKNRVTLTVEDGGTEILCDLGITEVDDQGVALKLNLDPYIVENDCCKIAYIRGVFLGSGSATLPRTEGSSSTGYHIEFVFTNYQTATDFCELLSEVYFLPRLAERKGSYIVYLKSMDEISDLLALMGANKSVLTLSELSVEKDMNNRENRRLNCEMSNMTKQIDASVKQIRAAQKIDEVIGLASLPEPLRLVAEKRREFKGMTLAELAAELKITKSCLNHRLRKIVEISENL